jgi:hypothetical protein
MKNLKIRFFHDAAHGWYEVGFSVLQDMGIAHKITRYSYRKGDMAYLEEDCDATLFFDKAKELGYNVKVDEEDIYSEDSIVRTYWPYKTTVTCFL